MNFKETLSSSVLFTFTQELDFLLDMLENGIKPRYSFESLPNNFKHYLLPMKCFCDIPLSKTKVHLDWYGNYGLGIKKETLKKRGTTPVWYVHETSVNQVVKPLLENPKAERLFALMKKYHGTTYQLAPDNEPRRRSRTFYDEREWRYLPSKLNIQWFPKSYGIKEGLELAKQLNEKQSFQDDSILLDFEDIEYIIIKDLKDVAALRKAMRRKFPEELDFEFMMTKVLTAKQIKKDF
jgi:hypothetical protein